MLSETHKKLLDAARAVQGYRKLDYENYAEKNKKGRTSHEVRGLKSQLSITNWGDVIRRTSHEVRGLKSSATVRHNISVCRTSHNKMK